MVRGGLWPAQLHNVSTESEREVKGDKRTGRNLLGHMTISTFN